MLATKMIYRIRSAIGVQLQLLLQNALQTDLLHRRGQNEPKMRKGTLHGWRVYLCPMHMPDYSHSIASNLSEATGLAQDTSAIMICLECGGPVLDSYCSHCGERPINSSDYSLRHFLRHSLHD